MVNHRKVSSKWLIFSVSMGGILLGYFLSNPILFGSCQAMYVSDSVWHCLDVVLPSVGYFLILGSILFIIHNFFLNQLRNNTYSVWIKFATWWIPLSTLILIISPRSDGGMLYPSTREAFSVLLPVLFISISVGIFIRSRYLYKNPHSKHSGLTSVGIIFLCICGGLGLLWVIAGIL